MDYGTSYQNVTSLADTIRESVHQSKGPKATGLAARETERLGRLAPTDEYLATQAQYINNIRKMFEEVKPKEELGFTLEDTRSGKRGATTIASGNVGDYVVGSDVDVGQAFVDKLIMSESSGNPQAKYTTSDGRSFVGLGQIGAARLTDYNNATGSNVEQADLMQNVGLQKDVLDWHLADLSKYAKSLAEQTGMDPLGLVAVGHLGGRGGMAKFAKSSGKHNPADELGTSLMDYYRKFKS